MIRLAYIAQPMRYDESVTYLYFVRLPWSEAVATYTYPNNHVLHTVLVKAVSTLFGASPAALRIPAFLAGVAVIPATYAAARELYGGRAALFAAAICATSGALVLYSTNARGYTLVVLAFLLLVLSAARILRGARTSEWLAFAIVAALGLWTIPVMLYPLGAVSLWLALSFAVAEEPRRADLGRLGRALALAALLTLVLYAPVLSHDGLSALTRNKFVAATGWYQFLGELPSSFREAFASWSQGVWLIVYLVLAACAVVAVRRHRSVSRFPVGLPLAAYVWCAWLLAVNHRAPFARVWLWFLPVLAALGGAGLLLLSEGRPRARALVPSRLAAFIVAITIALATSVVLSRAVPLSLDTGTYRDASRAADLLARAIGPTDRVLVSLPTNAPLAFYLEQKGLSSSVMERDERAAGRVYVVVDEAEHQTLDAVAARSIVRDSTRFAPPRLFAQLPSSALIVFDSRNAAKR